MTDKNGTPAPYGLDGFGRAAARPLSSGDRFGAGAWTIALLASPALAAILTAVSGV